MFTITIANLPQTARNLHLRLQTSRKLHETYICDCKPPANCTKLTFAIANFLQTARNLHLRLQTSCKLHETYICDCKPPANCTKLTFAIASLPPLSKERLIKTKTKIAPVIIAIDYGGPRKHIRRMPLSR